ncbi:MAG: hypothetical protein PHX89_07170 [bacterium]|nr:hypothetical protein [bacterium]
MRRENTPSDMYPYAGRRFQNFSLPEALTIVPISMRDTPVPHMASTSLGALMNA